jgi:protein-S-isoprenylcysteine O-methyltransferase Ste14
MKKMGGPPAGIQERIYNNLTSLLYFVLIACTIFLPLRLGTVWFYLGSLIWLLGSMILVSALVTVTTTPLGQIFTRGIYRFSRHPLYLSMMLVFIGIGIAAASWVFVLGSGVYSVLLNSNAIMEEQTCLETFGEAYETYLNKTPRWIGIPKFEKD